jgi:hypothetical protein
MIFMAVALVDVLPKGIVSKPLASRQAMESQSIDVKNLFTNGWGGIHPTGRGIAAPGWRVERT